MNRNNDVKAFKARSCYLLIFAITNYDVIINGKILYDETIDSDIKQYVEIRKLTGHC